MMYNHYIPESNGVYKRHSIVVPDCSVTQEHVSDKEVESEEVPRQKKPEFIPSGGGWDLGDLLLLCIVILLLLESEDEDKFPILIAAVAFMFLQ